MNNDQTCDLLVHNAYVISVDAKRRVFSPGAVAVRGTSVAAVGPEREVIEGLGRRAARTIDARGAAVHPGFIDVHNHVVGAGCRGVFANEADDPASGVNYATWKADVTGDDEAAATTLTALQLLHAGYTGVVEAGTAFDTGATAEAAEAAGIRICLSEPYLWDDVTVMRELASLESRALFARAPPDFERCVAELGGELHRNGDPDGRQHGFVCLYGLGTASDELVRRADALAREHGVVLHQHEAYEIASARAETERLGRSRIAHLDSLGVLHSGSTLVHMNTLTDEDVDIVSERGCSVVWCPIPHLAMGLAGKVECRMPELLRRGVNVTLGSDSARSSAFGDEALAAQLVAANAGEPLAPETILEMLTINAARAAGLGELTGSLEPGKRADFVVTDPDAPEAFPAANPVHQAVLTCRGQAHARTVVVNGEVVIDEGRSTRLDEREACAAARASIHDRIRRLNLSDAMKWPVIGE